MVALIVGYQQPRTDFDVVSVVVSWRLTMLYWTLIFLVIALVAGLFGFGGIASASAGIAKILFVIFLVLFLLSLIFGAVRGV
jgi:uncharacterized membrane protein YtjA (UPF0391 family)